MNRERMKLALVLALAFAGGAREAVAQRATRTPLRQITRLVETAPMAGETSVALDRVTRLRFGGPLDPASVHPGSVFASSGGQLLATTLQVSLNGATILLGYPGFLPEQSTVEVRVDGDLLRDSYGVAVDADGDGRAGGVYVFTFDTGVNHPMQTGTAVVLGSVFDTSGNPLAGAVVEGFRFPRNEGDPPLAVPSGLSDASGAFTYVTPAFTGAGEFLIRVSAAGHSETLRPLPLVAGRCWSIADTILQPLSPPVHVVKEDGACIIDPTGQIQLDIPPAALAADSDISVTLLAGSGVLRDGLPPLVARPGVFVDVHGVFGETTNVPVCMTFPNTYGLPVGTRVPFGKVDHNTLEWGDLTDLYQGGGPPPPDYGVGIVSADGATIQVLFDHFCSICTGYCLPFPCDLPLPGPPLPPGPPPPPPPGPGPGPGPGVVFVPRLPGSAVVTTPGLPQATVVPPGLSIATPETPDYPSAEVSPPLFFGTPDGRLADAMIDDALVEPIWPDDWVQGTPGDRGATTDEGRPTATTDDDDDDGVVLTPLNPPIPDPRRGTLSAPWQQGLGRGTLVPPDQASPKGKVAGNSVVDLREGILTEELVLPGLQEFGSTFSVRFGYRSNTAKPSVVISQSVDYLSTRPVERTSFHFAIEGRKVAAFYDFTKNNIKPVANFLWDGVDGLAQLLPTGSYAYTGFSTSLNADAKVSLPALFGDVSVQSFVNEYPGLTELETEVVNERAVLVNLQDSPYGAGWSLLNETRLYLDPDACVVLVEGNSSWRLFRPDFSAPHRWFPHKGDPSELRYAPQSQQYTRTLGDGTRQVFNSAGRIVEERDRFGHAALYFYSGDRLVGITTSTGHHFDLVYDGNSKLAYVEDSAGRRTDFMVDVVGDLVSTTDPLGATRTFEYQDHLMSAQVDARGARTEYDYLQGRIVATRSYDVGGGLLRQRAFDPSVLHGEMTGAIAGGLGTLLNPIPVIVGRVDRFTDGNGNEWVHESGPFGTTREVDALGRATEYTIDETNGYVTRTTRPDGTYTEYNHDAEDRLTGVTHYSATSQPLATRTFQYDPGSAQANRITDPLGKTTEYVHDALGRVVLIRAHDLTETSFQYTDPSAPQLPSKVVWPDGACVVLSYDLHGNPETRTDFVGGMPRTTEYQYDAAGQVTRIIHPDLGESDFVYDDRGRIVQSTDPLDHATTYSYDEVSCGCSTDQITAVAYPGGASATYEYDGLGRMTRRGDALGAVSDWIWDPEGRLLDWINRDADPVSYQYDPAGQLLSRTTASEVTFFTYDEFGRATSATDSMCQLTFAYDGLGRLTGTSSSLDLTLEGGGIIPLVHTIQYSHDAAGNRLSMTDAAGLTQYFYDDRHRLSQLIDPAGRVFSFTYDAGGRLLSRTAVTANVTSTFTYDTAGQPTSLTHGTTTPLVLSWTAYNEMGQILALNYQLVSQTITASFAYDLAGQIVQAVMSPVYGDTRVNRTGTYDLANRLLFDEDHTYAHDDTGRMIGRDAVGSTLETHYEYDALGGLTRVLQEADPGGGLRDILDVTYVYDPLGRRVLRDVNGVVTRYVYDGDRLLHSFDSSSRLSASFVRHPVRDDLLAFTDHEVDATYYYLPDHLGSIVGLSDESGDPVQAYLYDEFGKRLHQGDPTLFQPFGFAGALFDPETGLILRGGRSYDATLGRYLTEHRTAHPGRRNRYPTAGNDAVNQR